MAAAKGKTTKGGAKARRPVKKSDIDPRWSILLFGLGLLVAALSFVPGESGWAWMRENILFGAFGISGWLLGPMLVYWAVLVSMEKPVFPAVIKGSIFLIALCGIALVFGSFGTSGYTALKESGAKAGEVLAALLENGKTKAGGGILSLIFGYSLLALLGRVAARILMVLLFIIALMLFTGVTPADVARFIYNLGDKIAGALEKDDYDEEYYEEDEEPEPAPVPAARRRRAAPAAVQPAAPRRMQTVDVPLDISATGAVPPARRTNTRGWGSVDIELGPDEPPTAPGKAEHVQPDIGPGGTFGLNAVPQKNGDETGLGDDYVPIIPFNPYSQSDAQQEPAGSGLLLFGEDDPYSALGGAESMLSHKALPMDIEHVDLPGGALEDDPDFELFAKQSGAQIAPLPNAGGLFASPSGSFDAEQPEEQPQQEYENPFEHAVRTAADTSFEEDPVLNAKRAEQLPWEAKIQPEHEEPFAAQDAAQDIFEEQAEAPAAEQADMPQTPAMAGETGGSAGLTPETEAMIKKAAEKKEDEKPARAAVKRGYEGPPLNCFATPDKADDAGAQEEMRLTSERLTSALASFGVQTKIIDVSRGPSVTRYEIQPQQGVKISRITALSDDIALNLAAHSVRIEAPIPGKPAVGIEVPNEKKAPVSIRSIFDSKRFIEEKSPLAIALGKDIAGEVVVADLTKMPHLLIAGSTGSGKSVCVNSIIMSFLYKSSPDDVRLVLIDPKIVELAEYNGIPHLLIPVVNEPKQAAKALGQMVAEMEKRYHMFAENNVRDIASYNKLAAKSDELDKIPHIAIVIDELADLMMVAGKDVETFICRIAQKARAAGMHLIVATQRPSVDVITGLIKSNIPSRIAFAVASQIDSRTILDGAGAEKLLGMGDMLFMPVGANKPVRVQGTYVTDKEISTALDFLKQNYSADYNDEFISDMEKVSLTGSGRGGGGQNSADAEEPDENLLADETFCEAVEIALDGGQISTSLLQRRLRIGYARAGRMTDQMEQMGIISPPEGSKPRQVLITRQDWQEMVMNAGE